MNRILTTDRFIGVVFTKPRSESWRELRGVLTHLHAHAIYQITLLAAVARLTSLLGLREAYPHLLMKPAHVLAWNSGPWLRSIIIGLGASDGLAPALRPLMEDAAAEAAAEAEEAR